MPESATVEPPSPGFRRERTTQLRSNEPAPPSEGTRGDFHLAHPFRTAVGLLAPVPLPVVLWISGALPAAAALGIAAALVLVALGQGSLGAYDLRGSRRLGDALLRAHPEPPPISALASWRAAELTSPRRRRELARRVRRLRRETEACVSLGSPRVDRGILDVSLALLRRLESRLELAPEQLTPLGMLYVQELAAGELGPLSAPERAGGLPTALRRALAALEQR